MYLRPTDGGPAVKLGVGEANDISPDGKWVLAQHITPSPPQFFLLPTGAGEAKPVTNDALAHLYSGFLPDGKRFVFIGVEAGHQRRTYIQDLDKGTPRAITPEGVFGLAVSPDGVTLAARNEQGLIALYPIAGGEPRAIPQLAPDHAILRWGTDNRTLYVRRAIPETRGAQILRLDLTTGQLTPVRQITPTAASVPNGGVGQLLITADAASYVYGYGVTLADLYLVSHLK